MWATPFCGILERRWNGEKDPDHDEDDWRGEIMKRPSGEGLKKLFEVRTDENDVTLLRKYLTEGLVERLGYVYLPAYGSRW